MRNIYLPDEKFVSTRREIFIIGQIIRYALYIEGENYVYQGRELREEFRLSVAIMCKALMGGKRRPSSRSARSLKKDGGDARFVRLLQ